MSEKMIIVMETTQGKVELELLPHIAPKACENMVGLVKKGYYDGVLFHRVIPGFMIQGGDPTGTGRGGESLWKKPFEDECSAVASFNKKGLLAMANSGPATNGSQFFITTAPTEWLNGRHTIFGRVISGYEVVEKVGNVSCDPNDRPLKEQKIIKMSVKG